MWPTDGSVEEADLLVGADGVHPRVRELAFGQEEQFVRYLGHHVIGCYAVGEGGFASFFLYRQENWRLADDPVAELRDRFGDLGWVVPELLHALSGDVYFDQAAQIEMENWHRDRVVLVGDACGAVPLLRGKPY